MNLKSTQDLSLRLCLGKTNKKVCIICQEKHIKHSKNCTTKEKVKANHHDTLQGCMLTSK